jgi:hypothetical protein
MEIKIYPKYALGEKVYLISIGEPVETEITSYAISACRNEAVGVGNQVSVSAKVIGYNIADFSFLFNGMTRTVPAEHLRTFTVKGKEKADKLSERIDFRVEDDVFYKAIINQEEDDLSGIGEIGTCCSHLSYAKDIIMQAQESKRLCKYELICLFEALEAGGHDEWADFCVNLKIVFEALGLTVTDDIDEGMYKLSLEY